MKQYNQPNQPNLRSKRTPPGHVFSEIRHVLPSIRPLQRPPEDNQQKGRSKIKTTTSIIDQSRKIKKPRKPEPFKIYKKTFFKPVPGS